MLIIEYISVCLVALVASGLTLLSGFGLGTILMPAFAVFFPLPLAIAATAVVHLLNNIFKVFIVGKNANRQAVVYFAVPAALAAIVGALSLGLLAGLPALGSYSLFGQLHEITVLESVVGALIIVFALADFIPGLASRLVFSGQSLIPGGLLSGFFGGLSGHQGIFRSAFLIKSGLTKDEYVATNVVSAVMIDVTRLLVYGFSFYAANFDLIGSRLGGPVAAAALAAFLGAYLAVLLLKKTTLRAIRIMVLVMLLLLGAGLGIGLF
jgi:uncharacterized protein